MVLVAGDAGVGKTRLLAELADRAQQRGTRVLVDGCVDLGDIGLAYLPVVDALGGLAADPDEADLLAEMARIAPGLGRLLPAVAEPGPTDAPAGEGLDQLQVFDAVRAVLVRRSQRSPVMLVLEDLHWADGATHDLLAFVARSLRSGRVLLVVPSLTGSAPPSRPPPNAGPRRSPGPRARPAASTSAGPPTLGPHRPVRLGPQRSPAVTLGRPAVCRRPRPRQRQPARHRHRRPCLAGGHLGLLAHRHAL